MARIVESYGLGRPRTARRERISRIVTHTAHFVALLLIVGTVVALLTKPLPQVQYAVAPFWTGTWSVASPPLATQRTQHTATLLSSGQVLVAGGDTNANTPSEMYDPVTDRWSPAPPMKTVRLGHTATLLASGDVFVAGGHGAGGHALRSAELYNPDTNQWTEVVDAMAAPRAGHTATLLASGKVLITGGHNQDRSAILYDPAARSWTDAGTMSTNRRHHTATLLADGRVLIAGGVTRDDRTGLDTANSSTEIYNPSANSWTQVGSMMLAQRHSHVAVLLRDGKVLVTGGIGPSGTALASAELYDPDQGKWIRTTWMAAERANFTATVLADGRVVVVGGCGMSCRVPVEFFDPDFRSWNRVSDMSSIRSAHTATLLPDGRALIVGGTCDCPDADDNPLPTEVLAMAPKLQFPWPTDIRDGSTVWYYSHGPHCNADSIRCPPNTVRYAVSFMPPHLKGEDSCAEERQTRSWVTAAADGEVRYAADNLVEIHHGFGFRTGYYHLADLQVSSGDQVTTGQKLGRPSCEHSRTFDVVATDVQVRFYTCQKEPSPGSTRDFCGPVDSGEHVRPIGGLLLDGWTVSERSSNFSGSLVKLTDRSRRANSQQCGVDDNCRTTSKDLIQNDVPRQLLRNADFEMAGSGDDVRGWVARSGTFVRSDDIPARSGRYSGRFVRSAKGNAVVRQEFSGISAGHTHIFQGWVNVPPTTRPFTLSIQIIWHNATKEPIHTDEVALLTSHTGGQWIAIGTPDGLVPPETATGAVLVMRAQGPGVDIFIDDVLLVVR